MLNDSVIDHDPTNNGKSSSVCPFFGSVESSSFSSTKAPKTLKSFEKIEEVGTVQSYRCPKCRNCFDYKNSCKIEEISIKEEIEQDLINKCVTVDIEKKLSVARLPFLCDPDLRLKANFEIALKVYKQQVNKLAKSPKDRSDVIEAEEKLHKMGFVDFLENLDLEDQLRILQALIQYYIPWRVVWSYSISTPVRPVFDGAFSPYGDCSVNEILAKGTHNMNNLIQNTYPLEN